MARCACVAGMLALLATAFALNGSAAQDEKVPTIKQIMGKAHKGGNALINHIGKDLKAAEPDWKHIQEDTKELLDLGKSLGKNTPPKGEKTAWEKVTKQYVDTATALNTAAEKMDKQAAVDAHKKLTTYCAGCHKAHK